MITWMNPKTKYFLLRLPRISRNYTIKHYMEGCVTTFGSANPTSSTTSTEKRSPWAHQTTPPHSTTTICSKNAFTKPCNAAYATTAQQQQT